MVTKLHTCEEETKLGLVLREVELDLFVTRFITRLSESPNSSLNTSEHMTDSQMFQKVEADLPAKI